DDPDRFVTHHATRAAGRHLRVRPEVAAADAGMGDAHDRIGRLDEGGVGDVLDADVAGAVHHGGSHPGTEAKRGRRLRRELGSSRAPSTRRRHVQITRNSLGTTPGPSDWFTGSVYLDTVATPSDGSRIGASCVHFTPGARTSWHTHPHGQTIWVLEGVG